MQSIVIAQTKLCYKSFQGSKKGKTAVVKPVKIAKEPEVEPEVIN